MFIDEFNYSNLLIQLVGYSKLLTITNKEDYKGFSLFMSSFDLLSNSLTVVKSSLNTQNHAKRNSDSSYAF